METIIKPDPFSRTLRKFVESLNAIGCFLTMLLMVIIVVDVSGRYLFNSPLTGTAEIATSMITVIAFLQCTYVQLEDKHLKVDILVNVLPDKISKKIKLLGSVLGLAVFMIFAKSSYAGLLISIASNEREGEGALVLPMWPVRATILGCCLVIIIIIIKQTVELLLTLKGRG